MTETVLHRLAGVREHEARPTLLAFAYFFLLLGSYFVLRPLREEMGVAAGVRNLPNLFLFTLAATALVTPLFGWCVQRFARHRMMTVSYRFFALQLLVFYGSTFVVDGESDIWMGRVFYVWLSVFNMFVVSVFWAFVSDGFGARQSKRLYGFVAAGGTAGALLGSLLTAGLADVIGRAHLLLVAYVMLEAAILVMRRLHGAFERMRAQMTATDEASVAAEREAERASWSGRFGGAFNGVGQTFRSPFLLAICSFFLLYPYCSTILYFQQAEIVDALGYSRDRVAATFGWIDAATQASTLLLQLFVTGRFVRRLGVSAALVLMPVLTAIGFGFLGVAPGILVVVLFQIVRRAANYALVRPARETLFTIVAREERYKAKSFIDTFVYRGGDAIGSVAYQLMANTLGMTVGAIAFASLPVTAIWGGVAVWLGRQHTRREAAAERAEAARSTGAVPDIA
ncbi:MAG TPA: MFS transporter [Candidatus Krumholzibacteria bacterium]|nr:MFS transporter [Candidatus Krumholzibacteria bacterium]